MQSVDLDKPMNRQRARTRLARLFPDSSEREYILGNLRPDGKDRMAWSANVGALRANFNEVVQFPEIGDRVYEGPALFIRSGHSDYIRRSDEPAILKLFPNAEILEIEGTQGHFPHREKPKYVASIISSFIESAGHVGDLA